MNTGTAIYHLNETGWRHPLHDRPFDDPTDSDMDPSRGAGFFYAEQMVNAAVSRLATMRS